MYQKVEILIFFKKKKKTFLKFQSLKSKNIGKFQQFIIRR